MKNVLLVGLGRFGKHIAMQLSWDMKLWRLTGMKKGWARYCRL
jgi:hypothetical protein